MNLNPYFAVFFMGGVLSFSLLAEPSSQPSSTQAAATQPTSRPTNMVLPLTSSGNANLLFGRLTLDEKLSDFEVLVSYFKNYYGPMHRKEESASINFDTVVAQTQEAIRKTANDEDFFDVLAQFVVSFHDLHTGFMRPDPRIVSLGFRLRRAVDEKGNEKAVIYSVDRKALPESDYPIYVGDEVISISGQAPSVIADQLSSKINWSAKKAARDFIFAFISYRPGDRFNVDQLLKKDPIAVEIADRKNNHHMLHLRWMGAGLATRPAHISACANGFCSDLADLAAPTTGPTTTTATQPTVAPGDSSDDENAPKLDTMPAFMTAFEGCKGIPAADLPHWGDLEKGWTPEEEKILSDEPFKSDLGVCPVEIPGYRKPLKLGYLPLKDFYPNTAKFGGHIFETYFNIYKRLITYMEEHTDGLVIDTFGNPGGSGEYLKRILSLLSPTSMDMGTQTIPLTRYWLQSLWSEASQATEGSIDYARLHDLLREFIEARNAGKTHLVEKEIFQTRDVIPYSEKGIKVYSKPLFVLIDSFCGSCGDWFPGVLKTNHRATLIGTTTLGAGGNVRKYGPLPNSNSYLRITESLLVLPNHQLIEDQGVDPDHEIHLTQADFRWGYKNKEGFRSRLLEIVSDDLRERVLRPRLEKERAQIEAELRKLSSTKEKVEKRATTGPITRPATEPAEEPTTRPTL